MGTLNVHQPYFVSKHTGYNILSKEKLGKGRPNSPLPWSMRIVDWGDTTKNLGRSRDIPLVSWTFHFSTTSWVKRCGMSTNVHWLKVVSINKVGWGLDYPWWLNFNFSSITLKVVYTIARQYTCNYLTMRNLQY